MPNPYNDLNQYASTIKLVFEKIADRAFGGEHPDELAEELQQLLDADTLAEIISAAGQVENQ